MKFGDNYPNGPCRSDWDDVVCDCGWEYSEREVDLTDCEEKCELCNYLSNEKCPNCGNHLHCGGCI